MGAGTTCREGGHPRGDRDDMIHHMTAVPAR
jgi:hypothetical protein